MKKNQYSYGIYLLILVLLCSLLSGCQEVKDQNIHSNHQSNQQSSQLLEESSESFEETIQETEQESQTESSQREEESAQEEIKQLVEFEVKPGAYLTEILTDIVNAGWGESVDMLLDMLEQMDRDRHLYWKQIDNENERAFAAEGYIAPGWYQWEETAAVEEVLELLVGSWDELLTEEMLQKAAAQGYTVDEVLIMASIVEWESSYDPYNIVKANVAAVVRNRIESDTALQMDVTIFYLQESLAPYRDPEQYEGFYDTYIRSSLPAGPIGSPSIDSINAVLEPADTNDLFFVYDEEGNYYFAEDYEQHLVNCDLAGIY